MQDNNFDYFLKVSFENQQHTSSFENKKCILLVSVGQKYHDGERLTATIDLINRSNFDSCLIAVADTLQRHNYPEKSPEEALHYSRKMGDAWLQINEKTISSLTPTTNILRWDDALNDEAYTAFKEQLEREYRENDAFSAAYHATVNNFVARFQKRDPNVDVETIFSNCLTYLIEECPIIMPLWASQGYDYIIYPKPMTDAMAMTYKTLVQPFYADKASWLSLKFKKLSKPHYEKQHQITPDAYHKDIAINL